jgi:hypothetical protein
MRAARIGLVTAALLAGACSLSLDGDHFRGGSDGGPPSPDARAPAPREPEELDCADPEETCKPHCEHRRCVIDCREADRCEASCKDARCTIDCTGARECDHVKCEEGSGCLLDCTDTERCGFDACDGEVTSCPGGTVACNRDCP